MKSYEVGGILLTECEPQIVVVDYGTALVTPERVQDVLDKSFEVWGQDRIAVLIKASGGVDLMRIASVVEDEALADFTVAVAIYTPSKVMRLIGHLFMQFQRSPYPQQSFDDEADALAWLRARVAADAKRKISVS
ncbi:MAG: STAS/SEC14 domain-containing protein [Alphaproteobacteria bacterium]|nr:STAS/SEC14 domain-containing protein [Alphaproteobacteria bacterium]MBO6627142.1 STAS/SEC14 domain-containing protein [Alphaproteobacteria bacterium]MDF1626367.1 STAS/SEC14 domain-containing protein [Parvibaculaceae bacterium]|tara:strand:- start:57 stop:461 length:405 start_codon:yes stop_codon:yes gene_type:complete